MANLCACLLAALCHHPLHVSTWPVHAGAFAACCSISHGDGERLLTVVADAPRLAAADALHAAVTSERVAAPVHACCPHDAGHVDSDSQHQECCSVAPHVRKHPRWLPRRLQQRDWQPADAVALARSLCAGIDVFRGFCGRISEQVSLHTDWRPAKLRSSAATA